MIYAPVIITTCNRWKHLSDCLDSLKKCTHADETDVFISVDYPPSEKCVDGHAKVTEMLKTFDGSAFHQLHVYYQDRNLGPSANMEFLHSTVKRLGYDRYINSEDDNIFAPAFLDFINKGLNRYAGDESVALVCGYTEKNISNGEIDGYFLKGDATYYGCGAFYRYQADKTAFVQDDNILKMALTPSKMLSIRRYSKGRFGMIVEGILTGYSEAFHHHDGSIAGIDVLSNTYILLSHKRSLFPAHNLVYNNGRDGSGVNCQEGDPPSQEIDYYGTEYPLDKVVELDTRNLYQEKGSLKWEIWQLIYLLEYFWWLIFIRKLKEKPTT